MTHEARETSQRRCELAAALACAALTVCTEGTAWNEGEHCVVTVALAVLCYLAAFGACDRATRWLVLTSGGYLGEWRLNWLLIPYLGAFFYALNVSWYFQQELAPEAALFSALTIGVTLTIGTFPVWLGGCLWRVLRA